MKLTIKDPKKVAKFTAIFQHLKQLIDTIAIYFDNDKMYIQGMDNTQICLFECRLTKMWFDEYEFSDGIDDGRICVNTSILYKVISTIDEKHMIELSYSGNTDILNIRFGDTQDNVFNKCFEISLIDLDIELMTIPNVEALVDLSINTSKFSKLVSQLLIFSDVLTLNFTDEDIKFKATGTEGSMNSTIDLDDVNEYAIGEDSTLQQSYSLTFINIMCSFAKLNNTITMGFSENMPMSFVYDLDKECNLGEDEDDGAEDDGAEEDENKSVNGNDSDVFSDSDNDEESVPNSNKCFVGFYLAPKMDDDSF